MHKIIVTGGLGFIGSNLIKLLIDKKFEVINLDKVTYSSNFYNTKEYTKNLNYKFIKCDLNNKNKLSKIIFKYRPIGIFNLLEIFRKYSKINKRIKLIHVSTDEVYGDILKGRSHENFPYKPSSPYAASKAASDHLVSSYVRTYGIPAIVTNCSNNYGPKQHPEKLIPKLIYNILNNKSLPIYGDGKNSREWIYVEDHCEALIKVFQKGKIGEFYNIGSNKNLNNLEICKALIKIAKKNYLVASNVKIQFVKDRPGHDIRYALDSKKIIKKLRWKTKISFEKGLEKTFLWYLNNNNYYKSISRMDIVKRLGKND